MQIVDAFAKNNNQLRKKLDQLLPDTGTRTDDQKHFRFVVLPESHRISLLIVGSLILNESLCQRNRFAPQFILDFLLL